MPPGSPLEGLGNQHSLASRQKLNWHLVNSRSKQIKVRLFSLVYRYSYLSRHRETLENWGEWHNARVLKGELNPKIKFVLFERTLKITVRPRTHGNVFLHFCIVFCSQGNREQPAHYLKQYKNAGKRFCIVYCSLGNRKQPAHYLKQ